MTEAAWAETLAAYLPRLEHMALRYRRHADLDDLVQEGWIAVWQSLARGIDPSNLVIEGRMKNWVRYVSKHDGASYEETMEKIS